MCKIQNWFCSLGIRLLIGWSHVMGKRHNYVFDVVQRIDYSWTLWSILPWALCRIIDCFKISACFQCNHFYISTDISTSIMVWMICIGTHLRSFRIDTHPIYVHSKLRCQGPQRYAMFAILITHVYCAYLPAINQLDTMAYFALTITPADIEIDKIVTDLGNNGSGFAVINGVLFPGSQSRSRVIGWPMWTQTWLHAYMYKKRLHGVTCLKRVTGDNERGKQQCR